MGENLSIKELLSTYAVQGTGHEKTNNTQTPMESSWYGQQLGVQTELPLITLLIFHSPSLYVLRSGVIILENFTISLNHLNT